MESYMNRGFGSPMARLSRANSEMGLGSPRVEPGLAGRMSSLMTSAGRILHSSSSWSQSARSCVLWISFVGTKVSMISVLSFRVWRRSRIIWSMSSRSPWLNCWMSTISCCAFWYLSQSFWSLAVSLATCSSCDAHFSSSSRFSCLWTSSILFSSSSFACCFMSRFCCLFSSASCSMAFSMTCFPTTILPSMSMSLCCSSLLRSASSWLAACSLSICSRSLALSPSAMSRWAATSARFCSAMRRKCSFSCRSCASMAAFSSGEAPCSTTTSLSMILSTIFSLYSTCFSTRTPGAAKPGMRLPSASTPSPPLVVSSALSRMISSWNSRIMASFGSSLIFGLFLMLLAR
mmetsp:Transcript_66424/g.194828  ORF Transcript_66424/g.194828 Transcript_66424/m.194828 type:complete len:347 (-) Transcript_66424:1134-2174(-)